MINFILKLIALYAIIIIICTSPDDDSDENETDDVIYDSYPERD